jgi:hypothetical protein
VLGMRGVPSSSRGEGPTRGGGRAVDGGGGGGDRPEVEGADGERRALREREMHGVGRECGRT